MGRDCSRTLRVIYFSMRNLPFNKICKSARHCTCRTHMVTHRRAIVVLSTDTFRRTRVCVNSQIYVYSYTCVHMFPRYLRQRYFSFFLFFTRNRRHSFSRNVNVRLGRHFGPGIPDNFVLSLFCFRLRRTILITSRGR